MAAQPPSLPYIRDEASTSQQVSYPSYPHEEYDHDMDMDGELEEEDTENAAMFQFWTAKRHMGRKGKNKAADEVALPWRLRSRLKTVNAGLFLCLNIGVDPPDIVKTNPCAKTECWVDPSTLPSTKAIEAIGRSEPNHSIPHVPQWLTQLPDLQQQFETLNPKVRYKVVRTMLLVSANQADRQCLDPSIEETKKVCSNLRKNSRDERSLFYYNGHGVPKPTNGGEIWVFNKSKHRRRRQTRATH